MESPQKYLMALIDDTRNTSITNQQALYTAAHNKILDEILDAASEGKFFIRYNTETLPNQVTDDLISFFASEGFTVTTMRRYGEVTERIKIDWTP